MGSDNFEACEGLLRPRIKKKKNWQRARTMFDEAKEDEGAR